MTFKNQRDREIYMVDMHANLRGLSVYTRSVYLHKLLMLTVLVTTIDALRHFETG